MPSPQSRNDLHCNRNSCEVVLIFRDRTPPPSFRRRRCDRAKRVGGLRSPPADKAAALWDQSRERVGHPPRRYGSFQARATPAWPAAQARGECIRRSDGRASGQRSQTRRHEVASPQATNQPQLTRARY